MNMEQWCKHADRKTHEEFGKKNPYSIVTLSQLMHGLASGETRTSPVRGRRFID